MLYSDIRSEAGQLTGNWWLFLLAGIGWLIVAAIVLRMNLASVATVGILLGTIFLVSGIEEIVVATVRQDWRLARVLMGIVFIAGALWCFIAPFNAFWSIAAAFGLLLIFKGVLDIGYSVATPGAQRGLVARARLGDPRDRARVLGLAAVLPGSGRPPAPVCRLLRRLQGHKRPRSRLPGALLELSGLVACRGAQARGPGWRPTPMSTRVPRRHTDERRRPDFGRLAASEGPRPLPTAYRYRRSSSSPVSSSGCISAPSSSTS